MLATPRQKPLQVCVTVEGTGEIGGPWDWGEAVLGGTSWHRQLDGLMNILGPNGKEEGACPKEEKLQE